MKRRALVFLAASAGLLLSTGRASAEEYSGVLARASFGLTGGPFIVPGVVTIGMAGAELQFGAQFNKLVGAYLTMSPEVPLGEWVGGRNAPVALMVDFTFNETIAIGIGPEIDLFEAERPGLHADGILGGGKLHLAWFPVDVHWGNLGGRKGFTLSFDFRLLLGPPDFARTTAKPPEPLTHTVPLLILPRLSISYQFAVPMFFSDL